MDILGIGTDIISKKRFLEKGNITNKFLNNDELELLKNLKGEDKIDFISGRWAAKESIIKATNKKITFSQISILKSKNGKPIVLIDGIAREDILVTISHDINYSIAFSIFLKV